MPQAFPAELRRDVVAVVRCKGADQPDYERFRDPRNT
jgi:hypothetical protein